MTHCLRRALIRGVREAGNLVGAESGMSHRKKLNRSASAQCREGQVVSKDPTPCYPAHEKRESHKSQYSRGGTGPQP